MANVLSDIVGEVVDGVLKEILKKADVTKRRRRRSTTRTRRAAPRRRKTRTTAARRQTSRKKTVRSRSKSKRRVTG